MIYCRPLSQFVLSDEFKPGEFEIIDFLTEHHMADDRRFLNTMRYESAQYDVERLMCIDRLIGYRRDEPARQLDLLTMQDRIIDEFRTIIKILKDRGFIRSDDFVQTMFLRFIMKDKDILEERDFIKQGVPQWYESDGYGLDDLIADDNGKFYETVKPMDNICFDRILKILEDYLTVDQYNAVKHYIKSHNVECPWFDYTQAESEAINCALSNIQKVYRWDDNFGAQINAIMDNTLF